MNFERVWNRRATGNDFDEDATALTSGADEHFAGPKGACIHRCSKLDLFQFNLRFLIQRACELVRRKCL
jgi:hypothetical protein